MLAVKSLNRGMVNGDSWRTLHQRLSLLPKGLSELYDQMWSRLELDDRQLYQNESFLYLSFYDHFPMSLLSFTLVVDQDLRKTLHRNDVPR